MDLAFELRGVSRRYGAHPALSDISIKLPGGRHTSVLGPSGCGKSTLLRLIAGLEAPSSGRILMGDAAVSEPGRILRPPHQRGIAMVFQDLALWPNLSALRNVLLGLAGAGLSKHQARERAEQAMKLCGIQALSARKPGQLSGGQQQRVALARAIAPRPAFLLLDEPFLGLDLVTKNLLLGEIQRLSQIQNMTLILVTHDPLEATMLCRHAIMLAEGRVSDQGCFDDLLRDPRSPLLLLFRDQIHRLNS